MLLVGDGRLDTDIGHAAVGPAADLHIGIVDAEGRQELVRRRHLVEGRDPDRAAERPSVDDPAPHHIGLAEIPGGRRDLARIDQAPDQGGADDLLVHDHLLDLPGLEAVLGRQLLQKLEMAAPVIAEGQVGAGGDKAGPELSAQKAGHEVPRGRRRGLRIEGKLDQDIDPHPLKDLLLLLARGQDLPRSVSEKDLRVGVKCKDRRQKALFLLVEELLQEPAVSQMDAVEFADRDSGLSRTDKICNISDNLHDVPVFLCVPGPQQQARIDLLSLPE